MPQLDIATFPTQLFWLLVSFVVLYFVMWRIVIPRISSVMEERQSRVDSDLERAESLQKEAEEVLESYEKAMADGRSEAQAILRDATAKIAENQAAQEARLAEKISQITAEAESRIGAARDQAMSDIKSVATEVAQAAASKLSDADISADEADTAVDTIMRERA